METENPYKPPVSALQAPAVDMSADVLKRIRHGWVAGCVFGVVTLAVTLAAVSGAEIPRVDAWMFVDAALIFALAFGIYRKSRTCAVLMFAYFLASRIIDLVETGKLSGLLVSVIFVYYLWHGISGTFAYHRRLRKASSAAGDRN